MEDFKVIKFTPSSRFLQITFCFSLAIMGIISVIFACILKSKFGLVKVYRFPIFNFFTIFGGIQYIIAVIIFIFFNKNGNDTIYVEEVNNPYEFLDFIKVYFARQKYKKILLKKKKEEIKKELGLSK